MMSLENKTLWAQCSAAAGAFLWLALLFVPSSDPFDLRIIKALFLLGVLVIVPLGLSLVATPDRYGRHSVFYRLALVAQPVGALMAVCSYRFEQGLTAALFASAWMIVTTLIALYGLVRFLPRGAVRVEEAAIDAGLIYLIVGGGWFVLSRAGSQPLGFGDTIVLLTTIQHHLRRCDFGDSAGRCRNHVLARCRARGRVSYRVGPVDAGGAGRRANYTVAAHTHGRAGFAGGLFHRIICRDGARLCLCL